MRVVDAEMGDGFAKVGQAKAPKYSIVSAFLRRKKLIQLLHLLDKNAVGIVVCFVDN